MRVVWTGPTPIVLTKKITIQPFKPVEIEAKYWRSIHMRGLSNRMKECGVVARQLAYGRYSDQQVMHFARLAFGEEAAKIKEVSDATALLMDLLSDSKAERVSFAPSLAPVESGVTDEAPDAEEAEAPDAERPANAGEVAATWETPAERAAIVATMAAEGVTISEIAEAVGVSASTVRKDMKRAE